MPYLLRFYIYFKSYNFDIFLQKVFYKDKILLII
jgi:hypothetical protein